MSADTSLTSLHDGNVFPVTSGLSATTGAQTAGAQTASPPTTDQQAAQPTEDVSSHQSELSVESDASESEGVLSGYDLVTDMMRRQDEVLGQLDELNDRIELAIDQISAARKSEIEALNAKSEQTDSDGYMPVQKKAA